MSKVKVNVNEKCENHFWHIGYLCTVDTFTYAYLNDTHSTLHKSAAEMPAGSVMEQSVEIIRCKSRHKCEIAEYTIFTRATLC